MQPALRARIAVAAILLALPPGAFAAPGTPAPAPPLRTPPKRPVTLDDILVHLAQLSARYRDAALRFTCDELIDYNPGPDGRATYDLEYIYIYDDGRGFLDYRTKRKVVHRKGKPPEEVNLTAYKLPSFMRRAYSWVFIFEPAKRGLYRFELVGEEDLRGRPTARVRFEALPPFREEVNDWFGTAWVDTGTYQLVRVEALNLKHHAEKQALEERRAGGPLGAGHEDGIYTYSETVTEFTPQKNGIAFPAKVVISAYRFRQRSAWEPFAFDKTNLFTVTQTYRNYRFFGVVTEENIPKTRSPANY